MPPRPQPNIHQLLLKTHKVTVALSGVTPNTTISQLKKEALEALKADISEDLLTSISSPPANPLSLESHNDINLCRQDKEKGRPMGTYSVLDPGYQVREIGLGPWETLYIQFINSATRAALPVTVTLPAIEDEDEPAAALPSLRATPAEDAKGKGKRKAEFSDDEMP